jgi:hypothetical protein
MVDHESLIKTYAQKLFETCQALAPQKLSEAEFRRPIDNLLEEFAQKAGLGPLLRVERTLTGRGRADAVLNRLVIEYEQPGKLSPNLTDTATAHAVDQVKRYLAGLAKEDRHQLTRLAGIAFDGQYIVFVRYYAGKFQIERPVEANLPALQRLLQWLSGTGPGIALTAHNLHRDFAMEELRTQKILHALYKGLQNALPHHPMVQNLFQQWRLFFSQSIDYTEAFGGNKLEPLKKWVGKAAITIENADEAEQFFFVLHTYFALLLKLLAWLTLSKHMGLKLGLPVLGELRSADGYTLKARLQDDLESGGLFRKYGLANLLEGDFFTWYLYAWNPAIEEALQTLLGRLDEYDPASLSIYPEESRDLFKKLYHALLPREIRHNLGEYYTPDWLAEYLLQRTDKTFFTEPDPETEPTLRTKLAHTRWLDPACGSGTFLVLLIARYRELGHRLFLPEAELLRTITQNIVGFDINPLAVLTARVNYLLAIADLLQHRKGEITIPVYLADSVQTPAAGESLFTAHTIRFETAAGTFHIPRTVCQPGSFDRFCNLLEESIIQHLSPPAFVARLTKQLPDLPWTSADTETLQTTYHHLQKLHDEGKDGIWARLLKNLFAPLTIGQFDYIVGNPPWINWEHLPDGYRQSIKPVWERYGLFPHGGMDTILGKGKKDISMLMTFTVMDRLLRAGGKLGFIITQSVFKTAGSGQGFRRFCIPQPNNQFVPLKVLHVDDMVALQPFEGASNRTAVMVLEKGEPTTYPVRYTLWRKKKGVRFTYDSSLAEVLSATVRLHFAAEPVAPPVDPNDPPTSPWLTAHPYAFMAIYKVRGQSDYKAHEGVNTGGANGVYWVKIIERRPDGLVLVRNLTEGAKVQVPEVVEAVEPDLLYPLLRGRDVQRWKAKPSACILMVQDPEKRRGYSEEWLQANYPFTHGYLKKEHFEEVLRKRAAFKRYFTRKDKNNRIVETGPFYSMFNVGPYTFAPWKVVWRYVASDFIVAVAEPYNGRLIVPNEKLMLVACENDQEAHYLCATLNSSPIRLAVRGFFVETQIAPHVIERLCIPRFDPENPVHRRLAALSMRAHRVAKREERAHKTAKRGKGAHKAAKRGKARVLRRIEARIDRVAARVWGLSRAELRAVQESLSELSGEVEAAALEE